MRTHDEIMADAEDRSPFSNSTQYEIWANNRGCYDCANDDYETEKRCPILSVALLGKWPREWEHREEPWTIGDASGVLDVVGECTEFDERPDDDGGGEADPEPDPGPPPVVDGQIDVFEVFADRIADESASRQPAGVTR